MTNGDWICDQCECHKLYCLWLPEGAFKKTCDPCAVKKMTCTEKEYRFQVEVSQVLEGRRFAPPEEEPGGGEVRSRVI